LIKKIEIKFSAINFFQVKVIKLWIRIWDRDPESGFAIIKNAGSGSVSGSTLNQCGSETLVITTFFPPHFIALWLHKCFFGSGRPNNYEYRRIRILAGHFYG
jgi:hypothetical protein